MSRAPGGGRAPSRPVRQGPDADWPAPPLQSVSNFELSFRAAQPVGQQRSDVAPEQVRIGMCSHLTLQAFGSPESFSAVQGSPSSAQVVGQLLGGSQVSDISTRPLGQTGTQSESVAPVQPVGQQRSPAAQAVMG